MVTNFSDHLGKKLEDYVKTLPVKVFVLRTHKRSGLIRARLLGAKHVTGQVITFLDAHCECTEGWLEPLLARIVENRKTVVCPIIDVISDETFEYITASDMTWGGFNWKLNFRWCVFYYILLATGEESRLITGYGTRKFRGHVTLGSYVPVTFLL